MKKIRNWIRYIVIIVFNLFFMFLFQSYINLILLIGLLLFPVYSIYAVKKVSEELSVQIMAPMEAMEKKSEFYLRFLLHNPTVFPIVNATITMDVENAFYRENGKHTLNVPVRAKKDTEVRYPIVMDYCGRLVVSVKEIVLADLLGVYEVTVPLSETRECLVFPTGESRNREAGQIYIHGVSESMESKEKGYDFSEVSGIREYIPGDKLQNIHWKLSVKKDELMVKERISVSAMQLNVLVELANDAEMRLESVLELAEGVTKSLVAQNLPFTIFYYSSNLGGLKECYIGNEVERRQWMEMVLYDQSYPDFGRVEQIFMEQMSEDSTYLYIGYDPGIRASEDVIYGAQQTVAVLRGSTS